MALREYLIAEVGQDHADGLMTRREALRRLGLLGLTVTAASAVLAACGDDDDDATGATAAPTAATAAATVTTASATTAAAPTTAAASTGGSSTAPAATSAPTGGTVPATSQASSATSAPTAAGDVSFTGAPGPVFAYFAPAAASSRKGAVLIIHENRGLTDHFRDLSRRFAADGYTALALDLASAEGGSSAIGDEGKVTAALGAIPAERLVEYMRAGLDQLGQWSPGAKLGIIGFCFGGGQVWSLLNAGEPRLAAAAPFYGPGPANADFSKSTAAVLGVYAELDGRVNASREAMTAALETAGLAHEIKTYPGVDHAFFNDTGARYDATQAGAAYQDVLAWFGTHLAT